MALNKVILLGRLTAEPELKHTPSGASVCSFSLAVERDYKPEGQPTADFINLTAWSKTAEFVTKYFSKGQLVAVTGRLQVRTYDDKEGKKRYLTEVVVEQVHFAEPKRNNTSSDASEPSNYEKTKDAMTEFNDSDFSAISDDDGDLPF